MLPVSRETYNDVQAAVRDLLNRSTAFQSIDPEKRHELACNLVQIGCCLVESDGICIPHVQQSACVRALAETKQPRNTHHQAGKNTDGEGPFAVDFPQFVSELINGVFGAIVGASIIQMNAYAELLADIAKGLSQFPDENVSQNQGRNHLIAQFPDVFQLTMDPGYLVDATPVGILCLSKTPVPPPASWGLK
jgi:hypothetical protein